MTASTWKEIKAKRRADAPNEVESGRAAAEEAFLLGEQVKNTRERLGLSQLELAQRIGTSQSAIARIEAGGGNPSLGSIHRVAEAMEMRVVIDFKPVAKRTSTTRRVGVVKNTAKKTAAAK